MRAAAILTFDKSLYLRGRQRLTTARRLSAYMLSRALARTTTFSYFGGLKINLSGISPAKRSRSGPNSFYMHTAQTCQRVTTLRKSWARSAHFGQKNGGWDESRGARFFCVVIQRTFRQLRNGRLSPNLVTKHSSVSLRGIWKDIFENFHFMGHLPPPPTMIRIG